MTGYRRALVPGGIKTRFSHGLARDEHRRPSRVGKGERGVWQRRYWEHLIRDETDLARHVDYIHGNPVKHGYVVRVSDWPYSTFHRWVRAGRLPSDWGMGGDEVGDAGERDLSMG